MEPEVNAENEDVNEDRWVIGFMLAGGLIGLGLAVPIAFDPAIGEARLVFGFGLGYVGAAVGWGVFAILSALGLFKER